MIELILRNLAITYYPQGICAMNNYNDYIKTFEFKNLIERVNSTFATIEENNISLSVLNELKKFHSLKNMEDVTLESSDRCLSFKASVVEGDLLYQLNLHISVIVPYYYVYVTKNNFQLEPYQWTNLPERNREAEATKFSSEIAFISNVIEKNFLFNKFPDSLVSTIIPDVNYADAELGSFSYFNAFFLNDIIL